MDFEITLHDLFCELPSGYLQTLVESLPRCVEALLSAHGGLKILGRCTSFLFVCGGGGAFQ